MHEDDGRAGAVVAKADNALREVDLCRVAWLDACADGEGRRIALLDAPAVLGCELFVATADEPARARAEVGAVLDRLMAVLSAPS